MSDERALIAIHPEGERPTAEIQPPETVTSVDTFAGKIRVKWAPEAAVSSLGLMPFFIEFLKTSGRFDAWVEECPLQYKSPNAPPRRDVLGTILLSVLAGHWRYAHMNALRGDGVNPEPLGMTKVASEDSVRRAMTAMEEQESEQWLKRHLRASYEPLLEEPWVLDMDTTVKLLYGHQEEAQVGYNPQKPGRPSHAYHSYFIANLRMVLEVEVQAGNQTASSFAQPELWTLLEGLSAASRPAFLRGDCRWGTERAMEGAEQRKMAYNGLSVPTEADGEREEVDRPIVRKGGVGGSGATLAGLGDRTAAKRMEPVAACGGVAAAAAAGRRGRSEGGEENQTKDRPSVGLGSARSDALGGAV